MAKVHYEGDVAYTIEHGTHRGWTWYYFELCGEKWKVLTTEADGDREARTTIYDADDSHYSRRHEAPKPLLMSSSFDGIMPLPTIIKLIRKVFAAFHEGIAEGEKVARANMRKSLGV